MLSLSSAAIATTPSRKKDGEPPSRNGETRSLAFMVRAKAKAGPVRNLGNFWYDPACRVESSGSGSSKTRRARAGRVLSRPSHDDCDVSSRMRTPDRALKLPEPQETKPEPQRRAEHNPMAEGEDLFLETPIPQQKTVGGILFPAVLSPKPAVELDLHQFTEAVKVHKPQLEALLRLSGALLLRGYPVRTAADFDQAVEAFGYEELPYVGGAAPRTNVVGRVFTANESPPDQPIPFHHEMAQVPKFPSKLFFFCEEEPRSGGETPIVLSHHVYDMMKARYPEFVEKLDKYGLIYTRILGEGDDPSSPIGRGWQSTFLTKDKSIAEERFVILAIYSYCFGMIASVVYSYYHG